LKEEKATLKGMVESCDELITEIAKEIGLDRMREDTEDEDEDEDGSDGEAAATPIAVVPPLALVPPIATAPEEVVEEKDPIEMVPEQEAPVGHEVILVDAKPEL
jgi:hypothetical protein